MARIKCRYNEWWCNHPYRMGAKKCNDPEYGQECTRFTDTYRDKETDLTVITRVCIHALRDRIQFENDYKKYEYDEYDGLRLPQRFICSDVIEYLEIDGCILVERTRGMREGGEASQ